MSLRTLAPAIDKNNKANAKKYICRPILFSPHFPRLRQMFLGRELLKEAREKKFVHLFPLMIVKTFDFVIFLCSKKLRI